MAKFGFDDLTVEFDNSSGALQNMSQYVDEVGGLDVEATLVESHTAGDSWAEMLFAGLKKASEVTLSGFYDDTATTGPNAIFNDIGCEATASGTRTLKLTWGSTKTSSVETIIKNYRRRPAKGNLTRFEVALVPTGAVTEA